MASKDRTLSVSAMKGLRTVNVVNARPTRKTAEVSMAREKANSSRLNILYFCSGSRSYLLKMPEVASYHGQTV